MPKDWQLWYERSSPKTQEFSVWEEEEQAKNPKEKIEGIMKKWHFITKDKRRECFKKKDMVNCMEYCLEVKSDEDSFYTDKIRKLLGPQQEHFPPRGEVEVIHLGHLGRTTASQVDAKEVKTGGGSWREKVEGPLAWRSHSEGT